MDIPAGKIRCLFGTDGVRDVANRGVMTPEMALRLGRAYVLFLTEKGIPRPTLVIGRDTRRSGQMLESAILAGLTSAGAQVLNIEVAPTPEVSFAVKRLHSHGGVVISASHNPAEYNGIKFLDGEGKKLSDENEASIEEYLGDNFLDDWRPTGASIGTVSLEKEIRRSYCEWLYCILASTGSLRNKLIIDCANGAASSVIRELVDDYDLPWDLVGDQPNGLNINDGVGVMAMKHLSELVLSGSYFMGIAYDGDADRVLLVDSLGRVIDGDIMLWVISRWMEKKGTLGKGLTATVMSNLALDEHLHQEGINLFRCPVGDRYVLQTMYENHSGLGGEQSGHVIINDYTTTGDGLCTGFVFLQALSDLGEEATSLVDRFDRYPQVLKNIVVRNKKLVLEHPSFNSIVQEASRTLEGMGRIFIRPSGTEPLIRILVEAKDRELMESISEDVAREISALVD